MKNGSDCKSSVGPCYCAQDRLLIATPQMFWDWYTVDACFISSTWHITSAGIFADSCVGVICLVILLEFLRGVQREHDHLLREGHTWTSSITSSSKHLSEQIQVKSSNGEVEGEGSHLSTESSNENGVGQTIPPSTPLSSIYPFAFSSAQIRDSVHRTHSDTQQLIRSGTYTCHFAVG